MENHLEVLVSVYRPAPSDLPISCPFRLAGAFRRLDLSKLTRSWSRHRSPSARKLGTVPHSHGQANATDTINRIEPIVPPHILRDTQAQRGASTAAEAMLFAFSVRDLAQVCPPARPCLGSGKTYCCGRLRRLDWIVACVVAVLEGIWGQMITVYEVTSLQTDAPYS